MKIWLLSEERPKENVVKQILEKYAEVFEKGKPEISEAGVKIRPDIKNDCFTFTYIVEGIKIPEIDSILIKLVSGESCFVDYLLYEQEEAPDESEVQHSPLMAFEETKTNDSESRNTATGQRGIKFVYIRLFYKDTKIKLYMLYNNNWSSKKSSATMKFNTHLLRTLGVEFIGKEVNEINDYVGFKEIDELISEKNSIKAHAGNTPIKITKYGEKKIEISGKLTKKDKNGEEKITNDPNIGTLSMIAACLRQLGWKGEIVFTQHEITQKMLKNATGNKLLYTCHENNVQLEGCSIPDNLTFPSQYWHYEVKSEKVASILLHMQAVYHGVSTVFENHAGCERGYFMGGIKSAEPVKKTANNKTISIPDLILYDNNSKSIVVVEGKKEVKLNEGIKELKKGYKHLKANYIDTHYPRANIKYYLSIFGGKWNTLKGHHNKKILFYLSESGHIIVNPKAPQFIKDLFEELPNQ